MTRMDVDVSLTEAEKERAIQELGFPNPLPIGRPPVWDDLSEVQKQGATARALRKRETPPAVAAPAPGVTHGELRAAFEAFADGASEVIYEIVDEKISPIAERVGGVEAGLQSRVDEKAALKLFHTLEPRVARIEGTTGGGTVDDGAVVALRRDLDELRREFDNLKKGTIETLERRASRGAEHAAALESRLKKVEREGR